MARLLEFDEETAVRKATEVFWKKGYAQTSMRDLTDAMQINSSSLYNTIGDKQQLFAKCVRNYTEMRIKVVNERYRNSDSPLKTLQKLIREGAHTIINEPNVCFCLKATFEIGEESSEINEIARSYDTFTHQLLTELIEKAQGLGEIANNDRPDAIANTILAFFTGSYYSSVLHRDPKRILDMSEFLIQQLQR